MKKIPRWSKLGWLICIPVGIVVAVLVSTSIDNSPEKDMALSFAKTNDAVVALFGADPEMQYHGDYPSGISFHRDGFRNSKHAFRVIGTNDTGKIIVHWKSKGGGEEFAVDRITRYRNDVVTTIWSSQ